MRSDATIRKEQGRLRRQLAAAEPLSGTWWRANTAIETLRWVQGLRLQGPADLIGAPLAPARKSGPRPRKAVSP